MELTDSLAAENVSALQALLPERSQRYPRLHFITMAELPAKGHAPDNTMALRPRSPHLTAIREDPQT